MAYQLLEFVEGMVVATCVVAGVSLTCFSDKALLKYRTEIPPMLSMSHEISSTSSQRAFLSAHRHYWTGRPFSVSCTLYCFTLQLH
jgi:hypothetical protein